MIRTIITAITGGKREWRVVKAGGLCWAEPMSFAKHWPAFEGEEVIASDMTERAARLLAARLRQKAEDRPEDVL